MIGSPIRTAQCGAQRHRQPVRWRAACMAVSIATAFTASTAAAAGIALADPGAGPGCPRWTAVLVPGTGETSSAADPAQPQSGMLRPIGDGLVARYGGDIQVRYLPYAASLAPTYRASESAGVQALSDLLGGLCASTRVVLAGYSQGADAAGDIAARIGHGQGPIPADRVVGVGLLSDPRRNSGTAQLGSAVPGEGIAGPRDSDFGALNGRVRTVCAQGDLYCATSPEASPALAAVGRAFTGSPNPTDPGTASSGTSSLSGLNPSEVTRQVVIVLAGLAETAANIPAILGGISQLPQLVTAIDIPGLHRVSGELNTLFNPLVAMAAQVDLHLVAQALSMAAPLDTSGWTAVAAQIVNILANVDVNRVATDIGIAQEVGWRAAEKLAIGDPVGGGLELIGLVPVAADLAAAAASALAGDAGGQLAGLATTLHTSTTPATTGALADLARQGADAAQFYSSGVHQTGYDSGVRQLLEWLTSQIDKQ